MTTWEKGDLAFFYHSNCDEPGIAGIATITRAGYPDPSQFDDQHSYYDEKSTEDEPRWFSFDVKWKRKFKRFVHLADLKANDKLADMRVVQRGSTAVDPAGRRAGVEGSLQNGRRQFDVMFYG